MSGMVKKKKTVTGGLWEKPIKRWDRLVERSYMHFGADQRKLLRQRCNEDVIK